MPVTDPAARLDVLERENRRLQRSVQELSMLNDLAREIGASLDADTVMQKIVRRALKCVHAEQGVIALVEAKDDDPMKTLVRTVGSAVKQDAYHLHPILLGWMLHHKQPLCLNDPAQDPRFRGVRWNAAVRSILCAPLLVRGRLIGILTVYNKQAAAGFTEDDQRLLSIIAAQSAQIVENTRLYEQEQALGRVREELRLAYEIQTSLLPAAPPAVPGYEIAGASRPAQTVGGDYFDYIPLADGRLALCVGDVSGKGLPASLLMANMQATLRSQAPWSPSAATCLERANRLLCQHIRKGTFVTLFYGVLDPLRHTFLYANAGHNRPLLRRAGGAVASLDLGGLALGFRPDHRYREATCSFAPGDLLLAYSDGLTEAMNTRRAQFGEDRLRALLETHGDDAPPALLERLLHAIEQHTGPAPPSDDVTLLLARRTP